MFLNKSYVYKYERAVKTECSKVLRSRGDMQGTVTLRHRTQLDASQREDHLNGFLWEGKNV